MIHGLFLFNPNLNTSLNTKENPCVITTKNQSITPRFMVNVTPAIILYTINVRYI